MKKINFLFKITIPILFFFSFNCIWSQVNIELLDNVQSKNKIVSYYPDMPQRLIAIGDIHGDANAIKELLIHLRLINSDLKWIGGSAYVVILGDILDRGTNSRFVIDLLMRLEVEAESQNGKVISLLGNHELLVLSGDYSFFHKKDAENYRGLFTHIDSNMSYEWILKLAFQKDSIYGEWINKRPTMVRIKDKVFVHGGIESWISNYRISDINFAVSNILKYHQGYHVSLDAYMGWVTSDSGPLWTRKLAQGKMSETFFNYYLDQALDGEINQLIVGHTRVEAPGPSPYYGKRLILTDASLSDAFGQNDLTAIEWINNQIHVKTFKRSSLPGSLIPDDLKFNPETDAVYFNEFIEY